MRIKKTVFFRYSAWKTDLRAMKSRHFAPLDLGLEDAKCVILRQAFHTHGMENLGFIVVLGIQRGRNSPLRRRPPPTALRPNLLPAPLEYAEYVNKY